MASALPLDEEEAVLTHDLELVVDLHAANGSAHLGHHANRKEGRLCERLQELLGLAERLVVPRRASGVVILHRPGERIRRAVLVQPPLLRHPNHGKKAFFSIVVL